MRIVAFRQTVRGSVALVALSGARGESLRPGSAEFRGLTLGFVSASGRESSATNEFSGLGDLPDGACWKEHA